MRINNNVMALNAHRQLGVNQSNGSKAMERLSSGMRINRAGDDAAGLAISEKMRGQVRGLKQASRNAQDGISLIQTGEGALNESHAILQRMRELVVQAGNQTNEPEDLQAIQDEITNLNTELTGIANRTEFNSKTLMDGTYNGESVTVGSGSGATTTPGKGITFQIGANADQTVTLNLNDMRAEALGTTDSSGNLSFAISTINVKQITHDSGASGVNSFNETLEAIDSAIETVSNERSKLGALQNRLEHTIANLGTSAENLQAAESRIRDLDMAEEMMEFTKNNILQQASTAMLAQANMAPQSVLQLLG